MTTCERRRRYCPLRWSSSGPPHPFRRRDSRVMRDVLQSATDVRSRVTGWMGRRFLAHLSKTGFDLGSSWFVPARVLAPLRRNGLNPVPELARMQANGPVTRLPLPVTVWLVTGYEASKQVLVDSESF